MKTIQSLIKTSLALLVAAACSFARAEIREPDNIIYGTIQLDGAPVTAARTNVVVEARLTPDGPAIGAYAMGSDTRLGNVFYAMRLRMETAPKVVAQHIGAGDHVYVILLESGLVRAMQDATIIERGVAMRLDFGASFDVNDIDGDGLPDVWRDTYLAETLGDEGDRTASGDFDQDGSSNLEEYIAGTDPVNSDDLFVVSIVSNAHPAVTFTTRPAAGLGYEGKQRYYALDAATALDPSDWQAMPWHDRIPASGSSITTDVSTNAAPFFRGRIWLE